MINRTSSLEKIYYTLDNFCDVISSQIISHYDITATSTMIANIKNYVCVPVWNKYRRSNIMFDNDKEGIKDFKNGLINTFYEVFTAFLTDTLHNIDFFNNLYGTKNTAFEKQVISSIMPINQKVNQSITGVNLASGTTGQQLSEIVQVNSAWNKAFELYFTPTKIGEHLNSFQWLFCFIINQYFDKLEDEDKNISIIVNIDEADLQLINIYCKLHDYDDWFRITGNIELTGDKISMRFEPAEEGYELTSLNVEYDDVIMLNESPFDSEILLDFYDITDDLTVKITGYY